MAALQKVYSCLSCGQEIKLARKEDNSGWDKFNLDGSPHVHPPKGGGKNTQQQQVQALANEVADMKAQIKILISQVQMLRSEFKELKERKDK
jgi:peptidoglycan hydrolase CwlO-like protein